MITSNVYAGSELNVKANDSLAPTFSSLKSKKTETVYVDGEKIQAVQLGTLSLPYVLSPNQVNDTSKIKRESIKFFLDEATNRVILEGDAIMHHGNGSFGPETYSPIYLDIRSNGKTFISVKKGRTYRMNNQTPQGFSYFAMFMPSLGQEIEIKYSTGNLGFGSIVDLSSGLYAIKTGRGSSLSPGRYILTKEGFVLRNWWGNITTRW